MLGKAVPMTILFSKYMTVFAKVLFYKHLCILETRMTDGNKGLSKVLNRPGFHSFEGNGR